MPVTGGRDKEMHMGRTLAVTAQLIEAFLGRPLRVVVPFWFALVRGRMRWPW